MLGQNILPVRNNVVCAKANILTCHFFSSLKVNLIVMGYTFPFGEYCDVSFEGKYFDLSRMVKQTGESQNENLLYTQSRVTVRSCFVYKVIRDLELIDHLCINPIHRIGLIHK